MLFYLGANTESVSFLIFEPQRHSGTEKSFSNFLSYSLCNSVFLLSPWFKPGHYLNTTVKRDSSDID